MRRFVCGWIVWFSTGQMKGGEGKGKEGGMRGHRLG